MRPAPFEPINRRTPIVFTTMLESLAPAWRTTTLVAAEFSIAGFFLAGTASATLGAPAPWFVLAAVFLSLVVRVADVRSWALFMRGGTAGRVREAFGPRASSVASAALLVERLTFAALAAVVFAGYAVALIFPRLGNIASATHATSQDVAVLLSIAVVGWCWYRTRLGASDLAAFVRWMWVPLFAIATLVVWGLVAVSVHGVPIPEPAWPVFETGAGWVQRLPRGLAWFGLTFLTFGRVLPALGGEFGLTRHAGDLPQPRLQSLRRAVVAVTPFLLLITVGAAFLFATLVTPADRLLRFETPLLAIVDALPAPWWAGPLLGVLTTVILGTLAIYAVQASLADAELMLRRLSQQGLLPSRLNLPDPRYGTPRQAIDAAAVAIVVSVLVSSGRLNWTAGAYGAALAWVYALKLASLSWLLGRSADSETNGAAGGTGAAGRATPVARARRRAMPWVATAALAGVITCAVLALLVVGDVPTWAGSGAVLALSAPLFVSMRRAENVPEVEESEAARFLAPLDFSIGHVDVAPGSLLVAVRHPHSLGHLVAALRQAAGRDVVVMTARLLGRDVDDDGAAAESLTPAERLLFSEVTALSERYGRGVRLLIVPSHDAFDAIIASVVQLRSSEVYVGESASLAADAQARLLGHAWDQAAQGEQRNVRVVVHHRSGRTQSYFLGAHAPTFGPADLHLIHELWLDATKTVGTQVHHHDVVRAALVQLAQRLQGPDREATMDVIRQVATPADEIHAVIERRDFPQLRDMMRNRPPQDLADMLSALEIEDQVVVFRVLPRKDAAATFEYLSQEAQEALLKAMAKEDVAALLNDMAPDDRTMLLEELPAPVTRQLLSLLTANERTMAVKLLGYPEGSIGRLMTPDYVSVREEWTVQQVLDFIREHGQDRETLDVIYVVDDDGRLADDIRIRELLLTPTGKRVADLMDRRFVALKATDDQETAVAEFRQHDRAALPVTDTAGMLIGIVTFDDVLDVAEAAATREIQRIGGSEAFDEPYTTISFGSMLRKRAGWLTALFLGEMLTATAMGAFEGEISRAVVLALFVPLIISSGGNSGSQASTIIIRALALGEVRLIDWWRVMRREMMAGLALGAILGGIGFLRITLWSAFSTVYGPHWLLVALTVSLALVGIVLWGTLVGSLLPFLLRRLGFDPATSSAPLVATLVDVTGLVIYFGVATIILRGTLL